MYDKAPSHPESVRGQIMICFVSSLASISWLPSVLAGIWDQIAWADARVQAAAIAFLGTVAAAVIAGLFLLKRSNLEHRLDQAHQAAGEALEKARLELGREESGSGREVEALQYRYGVQAAKCTSSCTVDAHGNATEQIQWSGVRVTREGLRQSRLVGHCGTGGPRGDASYSMRPKLTGTYYHKGSKLGLVERIKTDQRSEYDVVIPKKLYFGDEPLSYGLVWKVRKAFAVSSEDMAAYEEDTIKKEYVAVTTVIPTDQLELRLSLPHERAFEVECLAFFRGTEAELDAEKQYLRNENPVTKEGEGVYVLRVADPLLGCSYALAWMPED